MGKDLRVPKLERAKVFGIAAVGGFVATLVIVALILVSEVVLALPSGLFYAVIGNALGANGTDATSLGFYLHLLTGTLVGVVAASPIAAIKRIYIFMGYVGKRLLYGAIMGFLVWIFFFLPISYVQVVPSIEQSGDTFLDVSGRLIKISEMFSSIIISALGFHIQYGLIYAAITGAFIHQRIKVLSRIADSLS